MRNPKALVALLATVALPSVALADNELVMMSWGGAFGNSQNQAYNIPFAQERDVDVTMVDADNPATPIRAQVEAGNVTVDVADVEYSDAVRLCDEGLLEVIDPAILPPAPDGTPAQADFLEGAITDCGIANIVWSTIFAYNSTVTTSTPDSIDDFFNLEDYPGMRGMRRGAKANLEFALLGDGVPADEVYALLETPEGVDRAFAVLDRIRDNVIWWEAGAQPPQLLADGEVAMTTAYNGRIFDAAIGEGQPFEIVWDGQILDFDLFVIPRGAPNRELAMEYVAFATSTERLAAQAEFISYGPARLSSSALVGLYQDGKTEMAEHMPTAPENLENALVNSFEFWADRGTELNERFNAWLNQ